MPKWFLAGRREDRHSEASVPVFLGVGQLYEHALWPLCSLIWECAKGKCFSQRA